MNNFLILFLFTLSSNTSMIDTYRQSFEDDFNVNTSDIDITITNVEGQARCIHSTKTILVNRVFWNKISTSNKKELIYHELGHCALNLRHNDGIMKMSTFQTNNNWDELVNKMKADYKKKEGLQ